MKKFLGAIILMVAAFQPAMADEGYAWDRLDVKVTDKAALQNGAKLFVNYCLSCHSANSMRYNKLTELGLSEQEIEENLLFTSDKVGDLMKIAMSPEDGKKWMGATPPDLSVMARAKSENLGQPGTDYLYTYLRTFYRDQSRPNGWNNLTYPNVGMPNPLWTLSGPTEVTVTKVHEVEDEDGKHWRETVTHFDEHGFQKELSDKELSDYNGKESLDAKIKYLDEDKQEVFEKDMADLSAFLGWMSEPDQHFRKVLGTWVMLFLALFFVIAWFLNKSYWRHVK